MIPASSASNIDLCLKTHLWRTTHKTNVAKVAASLFHRYRKPVSSVGKLLCLIVVLVNVEPAQAQYTGGYTWVYFSSHSLDINLNYTAPDISIDRVTMTSLLGHTLDIPISLSYHRWQETPLVYSTAWATETGFFVLGSVSSADTADLANRPYTITFDGGTFDGLEQTFYLDEDLLPAVPTLSLAAQAALLSGNAARDIPLTLPDFSAPAELEDPTRELYIWNRTDLEMAVGSHLLTPDTNTFLIPSGSLISGKEYDFVLIDRGIGFSKTGPMGDALSVTYTNGFRLSFTAIPEPSAYALILGASTIGFIILSRRIRSKRHKSQLFQLGANNENSRLDQTLVGPSNTTLGRNPDDWLTPLTSIPRSDLFP